MRAVCRACQSKEGKEYYEKTKPPLKRDEVLGETKICNKCGNEYPRISEHFQNRKGSKDGLRNDCKLCGSKRGKEYHQNNRDNLLQVNKKYYYDNKEQLLKDKQEYYQDNREQIMQYATEYRKNNYEKVVQGRKKSYQRRKEKVLRKRKEYYSKNKNVILEKGKVYKEKHKDRYRKLQRELKRKKYATNLMFNLNEKMSSGIRISLRNNKNGRHWETLVNFNLIQLKQHLESLFQPGMTWEELLKGKIHIDHKRPKASFNFTTPDDIEFKQCWAMENLQPLWSEDNLRKRDKWEAS